MDLDILDALWEKSELGWVGDNECHRGLLCQGIAELGRIAANAVVKIRADIAGIIEQLHMGYIVAWLHRTKCS